PAGSTQVWLPGGARKRATVVDFNPSIDLALLHVPGLGERPLPVASGTVDERGAVFGHPNGQTSTAIQPAVIAEEVTATGQDLYHQHDTSRDVFELASELTYGDSGAPLVTTGGKVVGIAFAIAPDRRTTAYALSTSELSTLLNQPHPQAASTETCLSD